MLKQVKEKTSIDIYPPSAATSKLSEFQSHQLGLFICYGETTYMESDAYVDNMLVNPPNPNTLSFPASVDSAQWVLDAVAAGADYIVLTLGHHLGFNIFPHSTSYAATTTYDSNRGVLSTPVYSNYNISACTGADQQIVEKFVSQCRTSGIKFGLYYNIGKRVNYRRGVDLDDAAYDLTNTFYQTYEQYNRFVVDELKYIIDTYSPDYLWLDATWFYPRHFRSTRISRRFLQDIYNIKKDTLLIMNYYPSNGKVIPTASDVTQPPFSFNGQEMIVFPADIISFEYDYSLPSSDLDYNPVTIHNGQTYYIPREIIHSIFNNNQYFAEQDNFPTMHTAVELQARYNFAKARGVPYLLSVAANMAGDIPANQMTRFSEIVK